VGILAVPAAGVLGDDSGIDAQSVVELHAKSRPQSQHTGAIDVGQAAPDIVDIARTQYSISDNSDGGALADREVGNDRAVAAEPIAGYADGRGSADRELARHGQAGHDTDNTAQRTGAI